MSLFTFAVEGLPDGVLAAQVECPEGVTQILTDRAPFPRAASGMSDMLRRWSPQATRRPGAPLNPMEVLHLYGVAGALAFRLDGDVLRQVKACGAAVAFVDAYRTLATCFPLPGIYAAVSRTPLFYASARDMHEEYPLTRETTSGIGDETAWAFIPWTVGEVRGFTSMWWASGREFTQADRDELCKVVQSLVDILTPVSVATG